MLPADSQTFSLRVGVTLRGKAYYGSSSWGRVVVTPESITVRGLFRQHVHRKTEVVELRWSDSWLGGVVTVISLAEGVPSYSGFGMHRKQRLRAALEACGYSFTSETHGIQWRQWREPDADRARYGFSESGGD